MTNNYFQFFIMNDGIMNYDILEFKEKK